MNSSAWVRRVAFVVVCAAIAPATSMAQTNSSAPPPADCERQAALRKVAWAASSHSWISNVWEKERADNAVAWCRLRQSQGADRLNKGEDFGRTLFTGEGLHPVVGTMAPGNGLAGGATFNLEHASLATPIRYSGSAAGRVSTDGSWTVGGTVSMLGSGPRPDNDHRRAVLSVTHASLDALGYFGPGQTSDVNAATHFALRATRVGAEMTWPLGHGVDVFGGMDGLRATPARFDGTDTPSIEQRFTDAEAPALQTATTYVIAGGGASWRHPQAERLFGYRTEASVEVRWFHETHGAAYSFRRFDAAWSQQWTPETDADLGTISFTARLAALTTAGASRAPFYLQPTLGGSDVDGLGALRSYRDYRFRAPVALALTAEYDHAIVDPVVFMAFVDLGQVAPRVGQLDLGSLKHSIGAGLAVRAGGVAVLKFYVAFGGGEGSHMVFGGTTSFDTPTGPHVLF